MVYIDALYQRRWGVISIVFGITGVNYSLARSWIFPVQVLKIHWCICCWRFTLATLSGKNFIFTLCLWISISNQAGCHIYYHSAGYIHVMERREEQEELDIEGSCRIFPGDHMGGVFNNIL